MKGSTNKNFTLWEGQQIKSEIVQFFGVFDRLKGNKLSLGKRFNKLKFDTRGSTDESLEQQH